MQANFLYDALSPTKWRHRNKMQALHDNSIHIGEYTTNVRRLMLTCKQAYVKK